jgi:DNA-binding GntR family transcriptional regulator
LRPAATKSDAQKQIFLCRFPVSDPVGFPRMNNQERLSLVGLLKRTTVRAHRSAQYGNAAMRNLVTNDPWGHAVRTPDPGRFARAADTAKPTPSGNGSSAFAGADTPTRVAAVARSFEAHSMSETAKIPRRALHDELAELIRAMIIGGELRPGQRINEQALCARFLVSRTPLREALKVLSAERLVRLLPNRGAEVACITHPEADDLLLILGVLNTLAAELACARIDEREIAEIRAKYQAMVEDFHSGEKRSYLELDRAIHTAIFKASGNAALIDLHHLLETRLGSALSLVHTPPMCWHEAVEDHRRMIEALEDRDAAAFARLMREHTRHQAEVIHQALQALERKLGMGPRPVSGPSAAAD